jgi:hypothetical protein
MAAGDTNLYAYVFDSPTNFTDPSGEIVPFLLMCGRGALQSIGMDVLAGRKVDWLGAGLDCVTGGLGKIRNVHNVANSIEKTGRAKNKLGPIPDAVGAHTTFKRGGDGKISNYATYEPNPRSPSGFQEVKRVDITGRPHTNPDRTIVPTPHVKEVGQRGVRPAKPEELP